MNLWDTVHTRAYDLVVKNRFLNKIIWKNDITNYKNFVSELLKTQPAGNKIIDIPCGPLTFTAEIYAKDKLHQIQLLDLSPTAIKIAQKRLKRFGAGQNVSVNIGDATNLNIENQSIDLILSLGFLHLFNTPTPLDQILDEFYRILKPNGLIGFQILSKSNSFSDVFLKILHLTGQIGKPRTADFYVQMIKKHNFTPIKINQIGTMLYIKAQKS